MPLNPLKRNIFNCLEIQDVANIDQTGVFLTNESLEKSNSLVALCKNNFDEYCTSYYSIWHSTDFRNSDSDIIKHFHPLTPRYSEAFSPHPSKWFDDLLNNANIKQLWTLSTPALALENTTLRCTPTLKPSFIDPSLPGEGFPFDTFQENLVHTSEPLLVSHFTEDYEFAYVATNSKSYGFIESNKIILLNEQEIDKITSFRHAIVIDDGLKLMKNNSSSRLFYHSKLLLGTLITFRPHSDDSKIIALLPIKSGAGTLEFIEIDAPRMAFIEKPLKICAENAANFINALSGDYYGWGGHALNRDCAQLLKDYFAPFGRHLPIFSTQQIKVGENCSLEGLSNDEKISTLLIKAKPFQTILYRPGHVTLYLGMHNAIPLMFHQVWGVELHDSLGNEYRHIIGKAIVSTLEYGKELEGYGPKSNFLTLMTAFTVIE